MTRFEVMRRLGAMLRPLAPLISVSVVCRVINHGLGVAISALSAAGVVAVARGDVAIPALVGGLVVAALVKGGFRYLEQLSGHAVAFRLLSRLRVDVYRSLVPLAPAGLEDERSGDLVARVIGDVDRVEPFYAHTIAPLAGAVLVPLLAAGGLAIWVDPLVALSFLPLPLIGVFVVPWIRSATVFRLSSGARQGDGETAALFAEAVQGRRELAVFDATEQMVERLDATADATGALRGRLARLASVRGLAGDLVSGAAIVAVALVAVARFEAGVLGVGGLAAAIVTAWVAMAPVRALEELVADLEQALAAAERLFLLAARPPPVRETARPLRGSIPASDVAFRSVTVRVGGRSVVEGVDALLEEGTMTAVVGPSGAGKSTLVGLLVRFRDPDEGKVEIGGVDVAGIDSTYLRSQLTLVPQLPDFFYGTLRENLLIAAPDADDRRLWQALERVGLADWASALPVGLDTVIGELGETISGGQRQRISVARGFLRDTRLLILDEATSELDPASEATVLRALAAERGSRTLIVVAHRLDTVVDADRILVLDRGRLVEQGSHEELLSVGGVYAGLWRRHADVLT